METFADSDEPARSLCQHRGFSFKVPGLALALPSGAGGLFILSNEPAAPSIFNKAALLEMMEGELKRSHYLPQTRFSLRVPLKPEKDRRARWGHSFTHAQLRENVVFCSFLKADLKLEQGLKRINLGLKNEK